MKTNEETINSLFDRREVFYKRRKKQLTILSACFFVVFSLSAFALCTFFVGKGYTSDSMLLEQEAIIEGSPINTNDGHSVSAVDETKDTNSMSPRIYINELDVVPTRFMSLYVSTQFESMTAEEILSHFRIRLDIESLFADYSLCEEDRDHGFYVKPDGTIHERDYFMYHNAENSKLVSIILQGTNVADIFLLSDYFEEPISSYVYGKEVYIFHWQDNENEELFCEFVFRDNVGISIRMRNLGTSELIDLIEYIVTQEPIFIEAEIIP